MDIFNISLNQTIEHLSKPKESINETAYIQLFNRIKYKLDIPKDIKNLIFNSKTIVSVFFYYFILNYLDKQLNLVNENENFISSLYFLFTIILEKNSTCTLFELKNTEDMEYVDILFMYLEEYYNLLLNDPLKEDSCGKVTVDSSKQMTQLVDQIGSGEQFNTLNRLLQLVLEPRHDFGKGRVEDNLIRNIFNKSYKGKYDSVNIDVLKQQLTRYMRSNENKFITNNKITIDNLLNSEFFEADFFCYFHNNIQFCNENENVSPQLFKYVKLLLNDDELKLDISSVYDLLQKTKIAPKIITIVAFRETIFEANNIKYYMLDMSPDQETQQVYLSLNEIISAATLWDPNSKSKITPKIDGSSQENVKFKNILENTFLQKGNPNAAMNFPRRESILSGDFILQWGVNFIPDRDILEITVTVEYKKIQLPVFQCYLTGTGLSVAELGKLMSYIENYMNPARKIKPKKTEIIQIKEDDTKAVRDRIINPILEYDYKSIDKTYHLSEIENVKNLLFALLLDFKVSGDYGEANWIFQYNKIYISNKCALVTKDKLCALESILVGNPTLVNNKQENDKENTSPIIKTIKKFFVETKEIYKKCKKKVVSSKAEDDESGAAEQEKDKSHDQEQSKEATVLGDKEASESMRKLVKNFNFIFYQGNTQGYNNTYIKTALKSFYSKIYPLELYTPPHIELDRFIPLNIDYFKTFEIYKLFEIEQNCQSVIDTFNTNGDRLIQLKLANDELISTNVSDISELFIIVKNMEAFCNLIVEINKYMSQINIIQEIITNAFNTLLSICLMLSNTNFDTFETTLEFVIKKSNGEVTIDPENRKRDLGKNDSYDQVLQEISKNNNCSFLPYDRASNNSRLLAEFRKSIKELYKSVIRSNNNTLFSTIYTNMIQQTNLIPAGIKTIMINNLYHLLFNESDDDLSDKNFNLQIKNKLKFLIHLWECIQLKQRPAFKLLSESSHKLMIKPINLIINQMIETLYLQQSYQQELNAYIDSFHK